MFQSWSRRSKWLALLVVAAAVVVLVVILALVLPAAAAPHGAIATDAAPCQEVGEQLLRAGGNAVDVTVGILLCEGVSSAQSMGLGGGFLMTIYDRKRREAHVLDARETAPLAAAEDMFHGNGNLSLYSSLGVAVPGELAGYHEAHVRFGKLPWAQLVEPTIRLCEEGVPVIQYVANILKAKKSRILESPTLSALLVDPATGDVKKAGDLVKRTQLAKTLRVVAKEGGRALHDGSLTETFAEDLKEANSIVTAEDLRRYKPRWRAATRAELPGGFQLVSTPPPGSGPLLAHFLMLTAGLVQAPLDALQYHRIVEAMKFVYAARTVLGDEDFVPEAKARAELLVNKTYADEIRQKINDHATSTDPRYYGADWSAPEPQGTAHVAVITEDFAVSVTSTVNTEFGCMIVARQTGIILNNEMDDFSLPGVSSYYGVPPSPNNFIVPDKRPQSSMAPSIILDAQGDVRMVIGASGGTRITSAAGLVTLMHIYLGIDLDTAIRTKRIHHQLMPMTIQCEKGFPEDLRRAFAQFGHNTTDLSTTASSVMAISVDGDKYHPSGDARREGVIALL